MARPVSLTSSPVKTIPVKTRSPRQSKPGSTRFAGAEVKEGLLNHNPTTNILDAIKAATPKMGLIQRVNITPALAKDLLTLNTGNRPIKLNTVDRYTAAMKGGKWLFTGGVIGVTTEEKLIDGQQRLLAIIQSGKPQEFHIQTGLDPEAFGVLDSGRMRSGGDTLAISGFSNYNILAASIKAIIYYTEHSSTGAAIHSTRITNEQIVTWTHNAADLKLLIECHDYVYKDILGSGKFLRASSWIFIMFVFSKRHLADAKQFVHLLATGQDISLKQHSAIYLLREKLLGFKRETTTKKHFDLRMRYLIAGWNAFRMRKPITKLSVDTKKYELDKII